MDQSRDVTRVSCEVAAGLIESAAMGDSVPPAIADHIAACPICAPRLTLARRIDAVLRTRSVETPPDTFTTGVLARIRAERWRTEQVVDFGFNLAVAAGLMLILGGLVGFAWQLGALPVIDRAAAVLADGLSGLTRRAVTDTRVVMIGMLIATTAVGVWWWAEEDVAW